MPGTLKAVSTHHHTPVITVITGTHPGEVRGQGAPRGIPSFRAFLGWLCEGSRKAGGMAGGGNFPAAQPPGEPERKPDPCFSRSQDSGLYGTSSCPAPPGGLASPSSWTKPAADPCAQTRGCVPALHGSILALSHLCARLPLPRRSPPTAPCCSGSHVTLNCSQPSGVSEFHFQEPGKSEAPQDYLCF